MREKTLFEDFTKLTWVRWNRRKPKHNGSVYVRWNGKYTSQALVHGGMLTKLDGEETKYHVKDNKIIADYSKEQKKILKDLYWQEETHDAKGYRAYLESIAPPMHWESFQIPRNLAIDMIRKNQPVFTLNTRNNTIRRKMVTLKETENKALMYFVNKKNLIFLKK